MWNIIKKLEGMHAHKVRTHVVLLLTLTLMLTFQPKTMSFIEYLKVIGYIKFEQCGIIRF